MGSGNNEGGSGYIDSKNDEKNMPETDYESSEDHFGRVRFYGERTENETEIWSSVTMRYRVTPLSSSLEKDRNFDGGSVGDPQGHQQTFEDVSGINAAKIINTAASMAAGVIDSVTPASQQHYYEAVAAAGIFPTVASANEVTSDQMSDLTMNDTSNSTLLLQSHMEWPVRDPLYITIPITVIYVIILLIGLLGNVVTCIVIVRSRYLHTTTNYYLFSLAISDLLLLLSGLPVEMYSIWKRYPYIFGEYFCVGRGLAAETSSNATVLTITAFTIERYLAICRPFMIQKWQNKLSRVVRQILIIWVISVSLAIPQALQFGIVNGEIAPNRTSTFCLPKQPLIEHSFEIATFVFFVAPMILITVLYCLIGLTLRNASNVKESKLRLRKSLSNHKREVGQQRVLKMLVAVVVAFFVCWAPFHAQRLIASFVEDNQNQALQTTYYILTYVSGVLYYLSTCINPILYHIMSLKFRHAFQLVERHKSFQDPTSGSIKKKYVGMEQIKIHHGLDKILSLKKRFQENVNKCCGERYRKRQRRERELLVGPPSVSHSSHSRSQGIVLTEITPMTLCNNISHSTCHPNGSVETNVKLETKFQGSEV